MCGGVGVGVGLERATHGTVLMSIWNELDLGGRAQTDGEDWMERVVYIILEFIITSTRVWNVFINYALPS